VHPETLHLHGLGYDTTAFRSKPWSELRSPVRRSWISCSPFATTRPANPVRCGPASR
jgi:hypothetical protein